MMINKKNKLKKLITELVMEIIDDDGVSTINDYLQEGDIDYDNAERQIREIAEEIIDKKLSRIIKAAELLKENQNDR